MKRNLIISFIVFLFLITSCQKFDKSEVALPSKGVNTANQKSLMTDDEIKMDYDKNIRRIAKAVARSLKSKELRSLLKNEASKKMDGDFDILWKDLKEKVADKENKKFNDLIAENSDSDIGETSFAQKRNMLDNFTELYKRLQIAIPVNIEKWDINNFHPLVAFLPADYSEDWDEVEAYDNNGKIVKISNKNMPSMPVVVINLNERSDGNGVILNNYKMIPVDGTYLPQPTGLTGSTSSLGILLNWTNYSVQDPNNLIVVERNAGSGYAAIANLPTTVNDFLDPTSGLIMGNAYNYRIKVINDASSTGTTSSYSAAISVTYFSRPPAPKDFKVENTWANEMSLVWTNTNATPNIGTIKIERRIVGVTDWVPVANISGWLNSYLDQNLQYQTYPLNRYHYRISYNLGGNGTSDAVFDVAYNTQRTTGQPLYLTHIRVEDLGVIESWLNGAPEFIYTLATMASNGTAVKLQDQLQYKPDKDGRTIFNQHSPVIYMPNILLLSNWDKEFTQSVMSFYVFEDDVDITAELNIGFGVKKAIKNPVVGDIDVNFGVEATVKVASKDEKIGSQYILYWETPSTVKEFPSGGVKIRFSNAASSEAWQGTW